MLQRVGKPGDERAEGEHCKHRAPRQMRRGLGDQRRHQRDLQRADSRTVTERALIELLACRDR